MIWISNYRFTVGLIVRDGIVVDAPPLARSWSLGRLARQVWNDAKSRNGNTVRWIP
jgi:hypothetical protein